MNSTNELNSVGISILNTKDLNLTKVKMVELAERELRISEHCNGIYTLMAAMRLYFQSVENLDDVSIIIPEPLERVIPLYQQPKKERRNTKQPKQKSFAWKGRQ